MVEDRYLSKKRMLYIILLFKEVLLDMNILYRMKAFTRKRG